MTTKTAAVYIRVSSKAQAEKGESAKEQLERAGDWCRDNGYNLSGIYHDAGISGRRFKQRLMFQQLIAGVQAKLFDTLLVWAVDRSSRNQTWGHHLFDVLEYSKTDIVSLTQGTITNRMMFSIWLMMAEEESKVKSERTKFGARRRAMHGQTWGRLKYGYGRGNGQTVINEAEAAIITRIFQEIASGKVTRDVMDGLHSDGVFTQRGHNWTYAAMHGIIRSTEYKGFGFFGKVRYEHDLDDNRLVKRQPKENRVKILYPPIVSEELWRTANEVMTANRRIRSHKGHGHFYMLRHLIYCDHCGGRFQGQANNNRPAKGGGTQLRPKPYKYYTCATCRKIKGATWRRTIPAAKLEEVIKARLREYFTSPEMLERLIESRRQQFTDQDTFPELRHLDKTMARLEEERKRAIVAFEKGYKSTDELDLTMQTIVAQQSQIKHKADTLRANAEDYAAQVAVLADFKAQADILKENMEFFTEEQWAEVASNTIRKLVIGEEIEVEWVFGGLTMLNEVTP